MANEPVVTKAAWRRRALDNRTSLRVDNARICWHLERFLRRADLDGWVVAFDPMPDEVDLRPLVFADDPVCRFALTRTPTSGHDLGIHPATSALERHRYGYRQPVDGSAIVPDEEVVAVLVPGLAFDHRGHRLGFGAGYYDRLLERLGSAVLRIGVSDGFIVSELPIDAHDVAMTHVATEVGVVPAPW
ncbi:MAG: 5-formyltetrahydrofolate cyclo-ligase [Acidimicrobiales bacterium]